MSVDALLSRLDRVKKTGDRRWLACCPAHDDRSPSLAIRELDDGRVLVHDFGGCAVDEVLDAIGLAFDALYRERPREHQVKGERRPFIPADVFQIVRHEATVAAVIASRMYRDGTIGAGDNERLHVAVGRLNAVAEVAYE